MTDDGELTIHEPEAKVVRMVYNWYARGDEMGEKLSMTGIADRLSEVGVPTWEDIHGLTGTKERRRWAWSVSMVCKMLHKEAYKGVWYYGKSDGKSGGANPREDWIAVELPAIVKGDLWDAAQRAAKRNKTTAKRNVKHEYLMRYRLSCACGCKILSEHTARTRKDGTRTHYQYYRCSGWHGNVRPCKLPTFPARKVDAVIWNWVHDGLLKPKQLAQEIRTRQRKRGQELAPMHERLGVIDGLLAENRAKVERLLDLYLAGYFDREMLTQRRVELERRVEALEEERAKLTAVLEAEMLTEEQIVSILELGERVRAHLEGGATERKRHVIEMLDVHGTLAVEDDERVVYARATMVGLRERLSFPVASTTNRSSATRP